MESLLLLAFIIVIVLLFIIRSNQKESERRNERAFKSIKKDLLELKENTAKPTENEAPATYEAPVSPKTTEENVIQWKPYVPPAVAEAINEPELKSSYTVKPVEENIPVITPEKETTFQIKDSQPSESWWEKWVRNNPDLEKFVGENVANKIGIAVLVLGIAFFVKYAIDQNWIKEGGRVAIGIGCGIILTGIAHYLRNTYRSFSSVLAGGGIAVFYFTIAFAS